MQREYTNNIVVVTFTIAIDKKLGFSVSSFLNKLASLFSLEDT
jgi:hypothetical protein